MKTCAALLLAFEIGIAFVGGTFRTTAALLPGGSAEDTALREAAVFHNVEGVKAALKKGANVNAPSTTARHITPLEAVAMGTWRMENRATNLAKHVFIAANAKTMNGSGLESDLANITFDRLLKSGAKVSGMDDTGRTPLHIAAKYDNVRAAEILIKEGAKIMPKDGEGKTPLDYAESSAMIKLLKENGATEQ